MWSPEMGVDLIKKGATPLDPGLKEILL